jgi:hypothetical protein
MGDWILLGALVAPLYLKLWQLKVVHLERGLLRLEFGTMPSESKRRITKGPRRPEMHHRIDREHRR